MTRVVDWGPDGRDALRYTPPAGFLGTDTFSYTVRPDGVIGTGVVTVTVLDSDFREPEDPTAAMPGVAADFYVLPTPEQLPDFDDFEPYDGVIHGRIDFPSTNGEFAETGRSDDFGVVWTGWIDIPQAGFWTLETESDDGSRLYIGDEMIVDNDGTHGMRSRSGTIGLDVGRHAIRVEFFERGGGAGCIVRAGGPGMAFDVVPESMWSHGGTTGPATDLDGDGEVNADLGLLLAGWSQPGPTDLDGDGTTNGADLGLHARRLRLSPAARTDIRTPGPRKVRASCIRSVGVLGIPAGTRYAVRLNSDRTNYWVVASTLVGRRFRSLRRGEGTRWEVGTHGQAGTKVFKIIAPGGKATPAPLIGPALGANGVNPGQFITAFNERTKDANGKVVGCVITVYDDRSFEFEIKASPASVLIKDALKLESGSGEPNTKKVGTLTGDQLKAIAEEKMADLNSGSVEAAMRVIAGTARSMGVEVEEGVL